jgi:hypothetical protein
MTDALIAGGVIVGTATLLWVSYATGHADGTATGLSEGYDKGLSRGSDESCEACHLAGFEEGASETAHAIMEAIAQQKEAEAKAKSERVQQALVASVLGGEVLS